MMTRPPAPLTGSASAPADASARDGVATAPADRAQEALAQVPAAWVRRFEQALAGRDASPDEPADQGVDTEFLAAWLAQAWGLGPGTGTQRELPLTAGSPGAQAGGLGGTPPATGEASDGLPGREAAPSSPSSQSPPPALASATRGLSETGAGVASSTLPGPASSGASLTASASAGARAPASALAAGLAPAEGDAPVAGASPAAAGRHEDSASPGDVPAAATMAASPLPPGTWLPPASLEPAAPAPRAAESVWQQVQDMALRMAAGTGRAGVHQVRLDIDPRVLPGVQVTLQMMAGQVQVEFLCAGDATRRRLRAVAQRELGGMAQRLGRSIEVTLRASGIEAGGTGLGGGTGGDGDEERLHAGV